MKRGDFERHLRDQGMRFDHHGGKHDIWVNPATGAKASLLRHNRELAGPTLRNICKSLGVPRPSER